MTVQMCQKTKILCSTGRRERTNWYQARDGQERTRWSKSTGIGQGEEEEVDDSGQEGRMTGTAGDLYNPIPSGSHSNVEEAAR